MSAAKRDFFPSERSDEQSYKHFREFSLYSFTIFPLRSKGHFRSMQAPQGMLLVVPDRIKNR